MESQHGTPTQEGLPSGLGGKTLGRRPLPAVGPDPARLAEQLGILVIRPGDPQFPHRLLHIPHPPRELYVRGDVRLLAQDRALAIVGTRRGTGDSYRMALELAEQAATSGYLVVSGLAIGCDLMAHVGCLRARGKTVAVMAHGLDRVYPEAHATYADWILEEGGALVSEYPPRVAPTRSRFVARDRLQSALSSGVVVVQTGLKGGTMHTVRFALKQKRPVFCWSPEGVQGDFSGNLQLIQQGVAKPFRTWEELESLLRRAHTADEVADALPLAASPVDPSPCGPPAPESSPTESSEPCAPHLREF